MAKQFASETKVFTISLKSLALNIITWGVLVSSSLLLSNTSLLRVHIIVISKRGRR